MLSFLQDISDFRRAQGKRFKLEHILFFSILALLSNAKSYRNIDSFIRKRFERLKHDFDLNWKHSPSYVTLQTIFQGIDPVELESAFRSYSANLRKLIETNSTEGRIFCIAFDGKTLRGSFDHFSGKKALQQLSAYMADDKIILGHICISEKSNEIPAVQQLIEDLGLSGYVFTVDAMHCQKKLLELPVKQAIL